MKRLVTPADAKKAKLELASRFSSRPWWRGVGIVPSVTGGLAVRVNIAPGSDHEPIDIPDLCQGVPVERLVIEGYQARPGRSSPKRRST